MDLNDLLARTNACLNATTAVLLVLAVREIRRKNRVTHRKLMLAAVGSSVLFLVSYLTRVLLHGAHKIDAEGGLKVLYLCILISHMILAAAVVPLVLRSLYLASKERFEQHRRIARVTYPIWMYVSVTGVVVYFMLYHFPGHVP